MMPSRRLTILIAIVLFTSSLAAQTDSGEGRFAIARLKYSGGGDWYNDPSIIPNLHRFLRENTTISAAKDEVRVSIMDEELFSFPFLFMTGHGRVAFSEQEVERLRNYLTSGGFLYADDDYGMDPYFRRELSKVFPDKEMVELPFSHEIYHCHFQFDSGLPKIHEHDGNPPRGLAYFHEGRMVVFYTFESNISDGWADPDVHGDPAEVREQALRMGANIVIYALTQ